MTTNLANASITGAGLTRTFTARFSDVYNVKDFGAAGDGIQDDTTFIQNCLNAAYSNGANVKANKPVFFPSGEYKTTAPLYVLKTRGAHIYGAGMYTTTIRNYGTNAVFTASLSDPEPPDFLHSTLTVTAMTSGTIYRGMILQGVGTVFRPIIIGEFAPGTTGGVGTYTTTYSSAVASQLWTGINNTVLFLNQATFSTIEEMYFKASSGGCAVEWDWVTDTAGDDMATSQMLFSHVFFEGGDATGVDSAGVGCRVGASAQSDTSTWLDCFYGGGGSYAGLMCCNFNSIGHTVLGGNVSGPNRGVVCAGSSFIAIVGLNFQNTANFDIQIINAVEDGIAIDGCNSESDNFIDIQAPALNVAVNGCAQRSAASGDGYFLKYGGPVTINNCRSIRGGIATNNPVGPPLRINNCVFFRTDALSGIGYGNTNEVEITQTFFGDPQDSVADYWGHKRITLAGTRTYNVEGTTESDDSVLYSSICTNLDSISHTFTVNISGAGNPAIFTLTLNRFRPGLPIAFKTDGALPTGLSVDKTYYVLNDGATPQDNTFRVSETVGGAAVETTGIQSGIHTLRIVRIYAIGDRILKSDVSSGTSPGWYCTTAGPALAEIGGSVAVFKAEQNVA